MAMLDVKAAATVTAAARRGSMSTCHARRERNGYHHQLLQQRLGPPGSGAPPRSVGGRAWPQQRRWRTQYSYREDTAATTSMATPTHDARIAQRDSVHSKLTFLAVRAAALKGAATPTTPDSHLSSLIESHHVAAKRVQNPRGQVLWLEKEIVTILMQREEVGPQTTTALLKTMTLRTTNLENVAEILKRCKTPLSVPADMYAAAIRRCWDAVNIPVGERLQLALRVHCLHPSPATDVYYDIMRLAAAAGDAGVCADFLTQLRQRKIPVDMAWARPGFLETVLPVLVDGGYRKEAGCLLGVVASLTGVTPPLEAVARAHGVADLLQQVTDLPLVFPEVKATGLAFALSPLNPVQWTDSQLAAALRKYTNAAREHKAKNDSPAAAGSFADAMRFLDTAKASGQGVGEKTYQEAVALARLCGDWVRALDLYEGAREAGCATEAMVTSVLAALAPSKRVDIAKSIFKEHMGVRDGGRVVVGGRAAPPRKRDPAAGSNTKSRVEYLYQGLLRVCEEAGDSATARWTWELMQRRNVPVLKPAYVAMLKLHAADNDVESAREMWRGYAEGNQGTTPGVAPTGGLFEREVVYVYTQHMCAAGELREVDRVVQALAKWAEATRQHWGRADRTAFARVVNTVVYLTAKAAVAERRRTKAEGRGRDRRRAPEDKRGSEPGCGGRGGTPMPEPGEIPALLVAKHAYALAIQRDVAIEGANLRVLLDAALAAADVLLITRIFETLRGKGTFAETRFVMRQAVLACGDPEAVFAAALAFLQSTSEAAAAAAAAAAASAVANDPTTLPPHAYAVDVPRGTGSNNPSQRPPRAPARGPQPHTRRESPFSIPDFGATARVAATAADAATQDGVGGTPAGRDSKVNSDPREIEVLADPVLVGGGGAGALQRSSVMVDTATVRGVHERRHSVVRMSLHLFQVLVKELGVTPEGYCMLLRGVAEAGVFVAPGKTGRHARALGGMGAKTAEATRPVAQALFRMTAKFGKGLLHHPGVLMRVISVYPVEDFHACFEKQARGISETTVPAPVEMVELIFDHVAELAQHALRQQEREREEEDTTTTTRGRKEDQNARGPDRATTAALAALHRHHTPAELVTILTTCLAITERHGYRHVSGCRSPFYIATLEAVAAFCLPPLRRGGGEPGHDDPASDTWDTPTTLGDDAHVVVGGCDDDHGSSAYSHPTPGRHEHEDEPEGAAAHATRPADSAATAKAARACTELRGLLAASHPGRQDAVSVGLDAAAPSPLPAAPPRTHMSVAQRWGDAVGLVRNVLELLIDELQEHHGALKSGRRVPHRLLRAVRRVPAAYPNLASWVDMVEELCGKYAPERRRLQQEVDDLKAQLVRARHVRDK